MSSKLVPVKIKSSYANLPFLRLPAAQMTPDAAASLDQVRSEIEALGGCVRVSDMYRSSAMQAKAHQDYVTGKKKAYSPPAGGSVHEAGRAIDLDLAALIHHGSVPKGFKVFNENEIRAIFEKHGWTFIAGAGNPHMVDVLESWHIEYRAHFQKVYNANLKAGHKAAYKAMAKAMIHDLTVGAGGPGSGAEVATGNVAAQPKLITLGYLTEAAAKGGDGPKTQAAIRQFQSDRKLKADGIAGPATHAALDQAIAAKK